MGPLSSKSKNEIEPKIQFDADETNAWSTRNTMGIHYNKTTCMTVWTKQKLSHTEELNIKIENNEIEPVSSQKLLGLHIDENLNWTMHIDYLCAIISSIISLLKQLSHYIPENIKKQFYQGYILHRLWVQYLGRGGGGGNKQYNY